MMKNVFYFILKAIFVLKIFEFLPYVFGPVEKTACLERSQQTFVGLEDVLKTCLEDVLKTCLEDVLKTYLEDVLTKLWRQTKYLPGISVSNKSKCLSNKSRIHKSISENSKTNPKYGN